jgi:DNA repair protein RecO (recombination protein O)
VTVFTDTAGRRSIIDRGGRSLRSKRGRLLTFSRLELTYFMSSRSGMGYVSEVEPVASYSFEKSGSLGRLACASAALELLYDLLPEDEPQEALYHLTTQYFGALDTVGRQSILPLFISYFLKTLSYLGYRPNLAGCIGCGKPIEEFGAETKTAVNFSPKRGGLVCSACQMMGEYYIRLQSGRLASLSRLQRSSLAEAAGVKVGFGEAEEILELLGSFLKFQTETGELQTLKFLEKLKKTKL